MIYFYKLIFSKILSTMREKNYIKIGSLIYLVLVFTPIIPSGAFFSDHAKVTTLHRENDGAVGASTARKRKIGGSR